MLAPLYSTPSESVYLIGHWIRTKPCCKTQRHNPRSHLSPEKKVFFTIFRLKTLECKLKERSPSCNIFFSCCGPNLLWWWVDISDARKDFMIQIKDLNSASHLPSPMNNLYFRKCEFPAFKWTMQGKRKEKRICHLPRLFVTWFLELFVKDPPRLCDPLQTLLHGLDVHVGTVTLGELGVAVAPAVVVLAVEFAFAIAGDVAESSAHKILSQVVWQDQLQACEVRMRHIGVRVRMTLRGSNWTDAEFTLKAGHFWIFWIKFLFCFNGVLHFTKIPN